MWPFCFSTVKFNSPPSSLTTESRMYSFLNLNLKRCDFQGISIYFTISIAFKFSSDFLTIPSIFIHNFHQILIVFRPYLLQHFHPFRQERNIREKRIMQIKRVIFAHCFKILPRTKTELVLYEKFKLDNFLRS